jgi:hypothetical protein
MRHCQLFCWHGVLGLVSSIDYFVGQSAIRGPRARADLFMIS